MNTKRTDTSASDSPPVERDVVFEDLVRRQRRLKWLTGIAVALWCLAILTSTAVLLIYPIFYAPKERQMLQDLGSNGYAASSEPNSANPSPSPVTEKSMRRELGNQFVMTYVITKGILVVAASVVILSGGTLATLLLVIFHRRVTLQQINYSLAQISAQLKQLQGNSAA